MKNQRFFSLLNIVLKAKFRLLFAGREKIPLNIGRALLVMMLLLNGIGAGIMYDEFIVSGQSPYNILQMEVVLQFYGFLLILLSNYFPTVKQKNNLISAFYPLHPYKISIINHLADLVRPLYFYILIVLIAVAFTSDFFMPVQLALVLLWMYSAILMDNALKTVFYNTLQSTVMAVGVPVLLVLASGCYFVSGLFSEGILTYHQLGLTLLFVAVAGISVFKLDRNVISRVHQEENPVSTTRKQPGLIRLLFSMYYRRKASFISVTVVLITKILLFGFVYLFSRIADYDGVDPVILLYLYLIVSPVSIYTYIHNNIAGFFREAWLTIDLYSGKPTVLLKIYTLLVGPILIVDLIVSLTGLIITGFFEWKFLFFYLYSAIILHIFGIFGTIYHPRYVESFFSMDKIMGLKNNTSGLVIFYNLLTLLILIGAFEFGYLIYVTPFLLLLCAILITMTTSYASRKYHMYNVLFLKADS